MSTTIKKHGSIAEVQTRTFSTDSYGIITYTIVETMDYTSADAKVGDLIYADTSDGSFRCISSVVTQNPTGVGQRTSVYVGCQGTTYRYRISSSTSQEPIQTHEDWEDKIGGNGNEPKNDAIFKGTTTESEFDYFPATAANDFGGVSGFLDMALEVEVTVVTPSGNMSNPTWDSRYNNMAEIGTPIGGGAPQALTGRDWLLVGSNQETIGGAVKASYIYRMSGAKGWNKLIYK
jgi:hypothetical protein